MHRYDAGWNPDRPSVPDIESFRFNDAMDVAAFAEVGATTGWKTWPDVWHVDDDGEFQCCNRGSSLDSIRRWAGNPSGLLRAREVGVAETGCAPRWLILETRRRWMDPAPVTELDARAFLRLREILAGVAVRLVDCMIFDDALHWWSLHELTSGSTRWR